MFSALRLYEILFQIKDAPLELVDLRQNQAIYRYSILRAHGLEGYFPT